MNIHSPSPKTIVVIGAGVIGSAIAFQLAKRGAQVTILDSAEPGQGASNVSFAWINSLSKRPRHYHDLNRRSIDMWDRFARTLGNNLDLTWGGELRWTTTDAGAAEMRRSVKELQTWGYPIQLLDGAGLKEIEPDLVTGKVKLASYSGIDGQVNTSKLVQACLSHATECGAHFRPQSHVTGLAFSADGQTIRAVEVSGEQLACDAVVLAGGPDMPKLANLAGLTIPLHHTFGATIITTPTDRLFRQTAVVHTALDVDPIVALRQFPDGSVMVHGGSASTDKESLGQTDEDIAQIMTAAKQYIPALEAVEILEVRRGRRPLPQDGLPILGFSQAVPNLYLATMHSGVTLSALVSEFAASEIINQSRIDLLEPYRLERFAAL